MYFFYTYISENLNYMVKRNRQTTIFVRAEKRRHIIWLILLKIYVLVFLNLFLSLWVRSLSIWSCNLIFGFKYVGWLNYELITVLKKFQII